MALILASRLIYCIFALRLGLLLKNHRKKARRALDKEHEKVKKQEARIEAIEKFKNLPEEERQKRLEAKKARDAVFNSYLVHPPILHLKCFS